MSARRVLLALLTVALATTAGVAAAQSASPTAVPTDPPGETGDDWGTLFAVLVGLLLAIGLVVAVVAAAVSVALVELFGPFGDPIHLVLPTLVGSVPLVVLSVTASFGVELLWPLYLAALVALPAAGLLVRRRYR